MLARTFGCARVVFNDCLRLRDDLHAAGEKVSDTEIQRRVITLAKTTPERSWLGEVSSVALVQGVPGCAPGLPELVRFAVRETEGPQGRPSAVPVPQESPAVDPADPQRFCPARGAAVHR
jgi:hypothetical protein